MLLITDLNKEVGTLVPTPESREIAALRTPRSRLAVSNTVSERALLAVSSLGVALRTD